jgi:hypothetical protein
MVLWARPSSEHGLVDGVGGVAGEAAQDGVGRGGPDTDGGGELDHLVVVLLDQVPPDRPGHRRRRSAEGLLVGAVELDLVDPFDARQEVEVE